MKSIEQIMQSDHERLDLLLKAGAQQAHRGHWHEATELLKQFRNGIVDCHMKVEETMLFPAFEKHSGNANHPLTALLRKGHQDLRVFIQEMDEAINSQDTEEYDAILSTVSALLKLHDSKEETELYPYVSAALPDHGKAAGQIILEARQT